VYWLFPVAVEMCDYHKQQMYSTIKYA